MMMLMLLAGITNETIDRLKRIILKVGLNLERFGLNSSNNSGLAKLF